jgi:hypothetical protein
MHCGFSCRATSNAVVPAGGAAGSRTAPGLTVVRGTAASASAGARPRAAARSRIMRAIAFSLASDSASCPARWVSVYLTIGTLRRGIFRIFVDLKKKVL